MAAMADSDGTMVSISFPHRRGFCCSPRIARMLFSIVDDDDDAWRGVHFLFALLHCDGSISLDAFYARLTNSVRRVENTRDRENERNDSKLEDFFLFLSLLQFFHSAPDTTKEPEWHPLLVFTPHYTHRTFSTNKRLRHQRISIFRTDRFVESALCHPAWPRTAPMEK